ncbi:22132_t:CDS:1, partial [Gigaspora margarita]
QRGQETYYKKDENKVTPMAKASQTPCFENNNEKNLENLKKFFETLKNSVMILSDSSNKQNKFLGPELAPIIFSHDNPYVNHWTNTTTQQMDQLTTILQLPLSDLGAELNTVSDPTSHNNNQDHFFFSKEMFFDFDLPYPKHNFYLKTLPISDKIPIWKSSQISQSNLN